MTADIHDGKNFWDSDGGDIPEDVREVRYSPYGGIGYRETIHS